jgi:Transposase DDE domain group 1
MRQEADIRYVVTSLKGTAQHLYEDVYCQRGQMENLIKLHAQGRRLRGCVPPLASRDRQDARRTRRIVMDVEHEARLVGELLQLDLPQPWSKHHVTICNQGYDRALTLVDTVIFGIGVDISLHAGASGALAIAIPGAIAGGNRVVQVVKAGGGKDKAD